MNDRFEMKYVIRCTRGHISSDKKKIIGYSHINIILILLSKCTGKNMDYKFCYINKETNLNKERNEVYFETSSIIHYC